MSNDPISDPENEPAVIDPGGQGTGGGSSTTDAAIDPGGQGTGGGQ